MRSGDDARGNVQQSEYKEESLNQPAFTTKQEATQEIDKLIRQQDHVYSREKRAEQRGEHASPLHDQNVLAVRITSDG